MNFVPVSAQIVAIFLAIRTAPTQKRALFLRRDVVRCEFLYDSLGENTDSAESCQFFDAEFALLTSFLVLRCFRWVSMFSSDPEGPLGN
jgi:hypothetical protein